MDDHLYCETLYRYIIVGAIDVINPGMGLPDFRVEARDHVSAFELSRRHSGPTRKA